MTMMSTQNDQYLREFEEAERFLREHYADIIEHYEGKFIAILNSEVIDSDLDLIVLGDRMFSRFGVRHLFMPYISSTTPSPHTMSGPRRRLQ